MFIAVDGNIQIRMICNKWRIWNPKKHILAVFNLPINWVTELENWVSELVIHKGGGGYAYVDSVLNELTTSGVFFGGEGVWYYPENSGKVEGMKMTTSMNLYAIRLLKQIMSLLMVSVLWYLLWWRYSLLSRDNQDLQLFPSYGPRNLPNNICICDKPMYNEIYWITYSQLVN